MVQDEQHLCSDRRSPRLSDKDLIAVFPEVIEILPAKLRELDTQREALTAIIKEKSEQISNLPSDSQWFWHRWVELNEGGNLAVIDQTMSRIRRQLRIAKGLPAPKGALTDDMIQAARDVPIENVLDQSLRSGGKTLIGLCPFHEDRRPSFHVYPKGNRCWCFGCNSGGDVIDVVMRLEDCTFRKAVLLLAGEL